MLFHEAQTSVVTVSQTAAYNTATKKHQLCAAANFHFLGVMYPCLKAWTLVFSCFTHYYRVTLSPPVVGITRVGTFPGGLRAVLACR